MKHKCADERGASACGCHAMNETVEYVPVSPYHYESAQGFAALIEAGLIVYVPLADAERPPDPDYGL